MKKLLLSAFAAVMAFGVNAQSVVNNPDNKAYLGLRAALDVSIPGDFRYPNAKEDVLDPGAGISLGVVYNVPLVANLFVEPGLNFYYNTQSIDVNMPSDGNEVADILSNHSLRKFGMAIPVQFGYHFDFGDMNISLFTGPVLNVGFSNDYYLTTKEVVGLKEHLSGSMYSKDNPLVQMKRFDCAWRFGVGFNYSKFYFGLSGDVGMLNMVNSVNDVKMHENLFQLTLGYNFK